MADRVQILLDDAKAIIAMLKTPPKSQWSAYSDDKENDVLVSRFLDFRSSFNPYKKVADVERAPVFFVMPFLSVLKLRRPNIGAACRALDAMQNAIDLGIIKFDKNSAKVGDLSCVVASVVNNSGLTADSSRTEELIFKSFNVLTSLFNSEWSTKMTDKDVIDVFDFGFKVIFDSEYSALLHTLAETMLRAMVTVVFADLGQLRGEISSQINTCHIREIPVIDENQSSSENEGVSESVEEAETFEENTGKLLEAVEAPFEEEEEEEEEEALPEKATDSNETPEKEGNRRGLASIHEIFRFIANLIDDKYAPPYVLLGLRLLNTSLDFGARDIADCPALMAIIQNDISRNLLRLVTSPDIGIFSAANHSWHMLIRFMRRSLKFQIEKYFISIIAVISSDSAAIVPQIKDIALESLQQLLTVRFLPSQLFVNYDLGYYTCDVFKDLVNLLHDSVFSSTGVLEPRNVVALDCLLIILETFVESSKAYPQQDDHIPGSLSSVLDCSPSIRLKRKENIIYASRAFNKKPKEGIEYLINMKMFAHDPPTPNDIADFLMATPYLDKRQIGNYICDRANPEILPAYIKKFNFEGLRVDQALRKMLEAYRLPGEAAEIGKILTVFADHWFDSNNAPFVNSDAAYTLAYAVIMLNTDQHNPQVRRNQSVMDGAAFKANLSGTNGGSNHDEAMLDAIFKDIKENEIIIPTEHDGDIRDSHEWEVLMRKSSDPDLNFFFDGPVEWSDYELFKASWGPLSSALFFAADKCDITHESILRGIFTGYAHCVDLAARYGMSDVCDNVVIRLCKYASFIPGVDSAQEKGTKTPRQILTWKNVETAVYDLSNNEKCSLAIRTTLDVVHLHGDHIRNAWKNVIDIYVQLYRAQLLPVGLMHVDDFVDQKGYKDISPVYPDKDNAHRAEGGILSWFGLTSNEDPMKTAELMNSVHKERAAFIAELHPENLFSDSTYIALSSLVELLDQLIRATRIARGCALQVSGELSSHNQYEEIVIFLTEVVVRVVIENKDRLNRIWELVRSHFEYLITGFGCTTGVVARRATVGLIRIANRNLFRVGDEISESNEVMNCLSLLFKLGPSGLYLFSRDIAFGLYSLLRSNASNIHERKHWNIIFSLLEAVGAAVYSDEIVFRDRHSNAALDNVVDNYGKIINKPKFSGDTTESLLLRQKRPEHASSSQSVGGDLIHLSNRELNSSFSGKPRSTAETVTIVLAPNISSHNAQAFIKVADALVFLLPPHITPKNFERAIQCLRSMMEAVVDGGRHAVIHSLDTGEDGDDNEKLSESTRAARNAKEFELRYQQAAQAFIDLAFDLHAKVYKNYVEWAVSDPTVDTSVEYLWDNCWLPLIQAIARLCSDQRRDVRIHALTTLPRAIQLPEFDNLNPEQWHSCFVDVLFPLFTKLLEKIVINDQEIDEIRVRVIQLVVKTFLQHLRKLTALPDFGDLLVHLMNYMRRYWNCGLNNDLVRETIPESVKNMLLVVDNAGVFVNFPSLYEQTVEVLQTFLPEVVDKVMLHLPVGRGVDYVHAAKPAEEQVPVQEPPPPPAADTASPPPPHPPSRSSTENFKRREGPAIVV